MNAPETLLWCPECGRAFQKVCPLHDGENVHYTRTDLTAPGVDALLAFVRQVVTDECDGWFTDYQERAEALLRNHGLDAN